VEHVYAADWIAEKFGCANCRCDHPTYKFAEADLHNLWPALGAINSSRGKSFFGEVAGSKPTLPPSVADLKCSYKKLKDLVEPRRSVCLGETSPGLFSICTKNTVSRFKQRKGPSTSTSAGETSGYFERFPQTLESAGVNLYNRSHEPVPLQTLREALPEGNTGVLELRREVARLAWLA